MDLCEIITHVGRVFALFQFILPAVFNFIDIPVNVIECSKFFKQSDGGLFAHAGHARDVIRFIADDGFVIHDLVRAHTQFSDHIFIGDVILVVAR